jgi:hypothetical protein
VARALTEPFGAGEWLVEKHGASRRRSWRKLHIGVDADTGRIVAAALTTNDVEIYGSVASVTGDGAYDQDGVYGEVTERHPMRQSSFRHVRMLHRVMEPRLRRHSETGICN